MYILLTLDDFVDRNNTGESFKVLRLFYQADNTEESIIFEG